MPHDTAHVSPHGHDDFAFEHAPGLPAKLPKGEHVLWQGRPDAWRLAVESLALEWVIGYFALLILWRVASAMADFSAGVALASGVPLIVLGAAAVAILWGFCWVQARQTVYTVTTERVILRIGAALQVTLQMPYARLENIALDLKPSGHGTIAFEPAEDGGDQLSYLVLWPHVRPWHARKPQPAFRCIPAARDVAEILAETAEGRMAEPRLAPRASASAATQSGPAHAPMPAE